MSSISRTQQVLLLLRRQLQRDGTKNASDVAEAGVVQTEVGIGHAALARLMQAGVEDRAQLARAFVQAILTNELGPAVVNDASLQRIVARVAVAIEQDATLRTAFDAMLGDL